MRAKDVRASVRRDWAAVAGVLFETIHTLRAQCRQRAGLLVHSQGAATLDVGTVPGFVARFRRLDRLLAA